MGKNKRQEKAFPVHVLLGAVLVLGLPAILFHDYKEVSDLVDDGNEARMTIVALKATGSKGYKHYDAIIAGQPVRLRTKTYYQSNSSYPVLYHKGRLNSHLEHSKGSFYGYVVGTRTEGSWKIFQRQVGTDWLYAYVGVELFLIFGIFYLWHDYRRPASISG